MKKVVYFILVSLLVFTSCKKDTSDPTSPTEDTSTVTYSGKVYHTVKIGSQTWLKENLDVGTMIQGSTTSSNNGVIEKYCYANDTVNCRVYGGLYQWNEAMAYSTTPGAKGICPDGWHIPTKVEFQTLSTKVGGDANAYLAVGQATGTNSSDFSALLAGFYFPSNFGNLYAGTSFWSSVEHTAMNANAWYPGIADSSISDYSKSFGISIRCLKD